MTASRLGPRPGGYALAYPSGHESHAIRRRVRVRPYLRGSRLHDARHSLSSGEEPDPARPLRCPLEPAGLLIAGRQSRARRDRERTRVEIRDRIDQRGTLRTGPHQHHDSGDDDDHRENVDNFIHDSYLRVGPFRVRVIRGRFIRGVQGRTGYRRPRLDRRRQARRPYQAKHSRLHRARRSVLDVPRRLR